MPLDAKRPEQTALDPTKPNGTAWAGRMTMIFRVEDAETGAVLKEHRLLVMPRTYSYVPEARARILYTRDGAFVDMPLRHGVGFTRFSISGSTNYRPFVSADGAVVVDGAAALKDLDDTIRLYFGDDVRVPVLSGDDPPRRRRLVFVNLDHPVSKEDPSIPEWVVHPDRLLQVSKQSLKPFVYDYSFSFVALRAQPFPDDRKPLKDDLKPNIKSLAASLRDAPLDALEAFNSLREQYLNPIKSGLTDIAGAVTNFSTAVNSVIDTTAAEVMGVVSRISQMEAAVVSLSQAPWRALAQARAIKRDLYALLAVRDAFGNPSQRHSDVARFRQRSTPPTSISGSSRSLSSEDGAGSPIEVEVVEGDTLTSLAQRFRVDPLLIVVLGDLRAPFVDSSQSRPGSDPIGTGKRVVYAGERLLIPAPSLAAAYAAVDVVRPALTDERTIEERLFGGDFYLSPEGLIEIDSASGDVRVVRGLLNLIQAIDRIALPLRRGTLTHNQWKGSRLADDLGSWSTLRDVRLLAQSIDHTLRADPRIATVNEVRLEGRGGRYVVHFSATAINGRVLLTRAAV